MAINRVHISGNLTRDAEMRGSGVSVLAFSVAVNERRKNPQTDEWEDVASYVDCVLFGKRAQAVQEYLTRGTKVAVEGRLRQSRWETEDGKTRSKLEVIVDEMEFMSRREGGQRPRRADDAPVGGKQLGGGAYQPALRPQQAPRADVYGDEVPF